MFASFFSPSILNLNLNFHIETFYFQTEGNSAHLAIEESSDTLNYYTHFSKIIGEKYREYVDAQRQV